MATSPPNEMGPPPVGTNTNQSPSPDGSCKSSIDNKSKSILKKTYQLLTYTPKRCRHDPAKPFRFSMSLNLLFGFAATFTVANLYYNHPILNKLAEDFHVSNEQASLVPTMAQAGYAGGLLFLCPLGDLFPRRPFVLLLVWFTATAWYVHYNTRHS